jgi:phosphoglucosamine mutase
MEKLFGTDGIRGTVGEWPLIPDFFLKLGLVTGHYLTHQKNDPGKDDHREKTILIGRDTRRSGAMLQAALSAGLLASGVHVMDAGVIPTPGIAWLVKYLGVDAGAVISASHNPLRQNGVKFFGSNGRKLNEEIEAEIEKQVLHDGQRGLVPLSLSEQIGRLMDGGFTHEFYIQGLVAEHHGIGMDSLTIVVDCANGAASSFAPEVFGRLGAKVVAIHASPTGLNINLNAGSEHVRRWVGEMGMLIHQYQADFGLAFDGDADRVVFVDENGHLIDGDFILGMLGRFLDAKERLLKRSVVTTTMRNSGLKGYLDHLGIRLYETPVGDKYVVEKLYELQQSEGDGRAIGLGGEQSGHIVLVDDKHATGDGIRTALFVMRAYLESGAERMSQFAATVGKTPQVIASAFVGHGKRLDKKELAAIRSEILQETPGIIELNLRYSGTEPLFRLMAESDDSLTVQDLAQMAQRICRRIQDAAGCAGEEIDILDCTHGGIIAIE